MSSQNVLRWVIAVPCAFAVGVAIAFGSWHFRDRDFLKSFQRGNGSGHEANSTSKAQGGRGLAQHPASSSSMALPSLTQGAIVPQDRQPAREESAAILQQEKAKAANEALTSYILSQEEVPKPLDHPLVEALINKPNAMRGSNMIENAWLPGPLESGSLGLGGHPQDVLRDAAQAFNSPAYAPLRRDARAVADVTLGQVSRLMELQEVVQNRLEQGSGGSLGNTFGLGNGSGLNLSSTRRALGNIMTNAPGGAGSRSGDAPGNTVPFRGNYMTPPVGSPTVPVAAGAGSSELAAATALVAEYRRLLPNLSDEEMKEYLRRVDTEGKVAAMQWVVRTKGGPR